MKKRVWFPKSLQKAGPFSMRQIKPFLPRVDFKTVRIERMLKLSERIREPK